MSMQSWPHRTILALSITVLAAGAGCGDSGTGPAPSAISQAEALALTTALAASPSTSSLATFAPLALSLAARVGSVPLSPALSAQVAAAVTAAQGAATTAAVIGDYRAVGLLMNFNLAAPGAPPAVLSVFALLGWNGVNTAAQTVDNILFVGGSGLTSLAASGSGFTATLDGADGGATFLTRSPSAVYEATSGNFTVSSWSATGSRSCSQPVAGVGNVSCTVSQGQLSGSFAFIGVPPVGTGSVSFPATAFSAVPLVVLNLSLAP